MYEIKQVLLTLATKLGEMSKELVEKRSEETSPEMRIVRTVEATTLERVRLAVLETLEEL